MKWPARNSIFRLAAATAALFALLQAAPHGAHALCGDPTGDGHVTATDALATLVLATAGSYDAAADLAFAGAADGVVSATDALAVLATAVAGEIPPCAAATEARVYTVTSTCDFVTGGIAEIDASDFSVVRHHAGRTAGDAVIRESAGRVFVINRFAANNIQELDPANDLTTLWQCSVGTGANPHDFVLASPTRAYVSRYDSKSVAVVDPSAGPTCAGFVTGSIDLSAWGDEDGFPEMDQMVLVGDRLFVSVQRLDRRDFFRPTGNGALVVIDTTTDSVIGTVELAFANPFVETKGLFYSERAGRIYTGGPGTLFTDLDDGGIEAIDPATLTSDGLIMTGAELGGDVTDFVVLGSDRAYAIVAGVNFEASVVEVDLGDRAVVDTLATSDQLLADVEITELGRLWLADRNCFDPGLRVFSIADNAELTPAPIFPGIDPFNLVFSR